MVPLSPSHLSLPERDFDLKNGSFQIEIQDLSPSHTMLKSVCIMGGDFSVDIPFDPNLSVRFLDGPNGSGKTRSFKLLRGLFDLDPKQINLLIGTLPFEEVFCEFTNGTRLSLVPTTPSRHIPHLREYIAVYHHPLTGPQSHRVPYYNPHWSHPQPQPLPKWRRYLPKVRLFLADWFHQGIPEGKEIQHFLEDATRRAKESKKGTLPDRTNLLARSERLNQEVARCRQVGIEVDSSPSLNQQTLDQLPDEVVSIFSQLVLQGERKVRAFRDLRERLELFLHAVNSRLNQPIRVDLSHPFKNISHLSGGSMRLIRMFYELAFTIEPGSIVLLDGIDRSFGPVWQQNLLQDLDAMARLRGNRYLCTSYTSLPQQHPDRVIHIQNS